MIEAIVTDIEGTTSSLAFVKDVLFPYARERLADFVRTRCDDPEVKAVVEEIRALAGRELDLEQVIARLLEWSDQDRKIPPLKTLQGMIWRWGYENGDFQGHLYEDAARMLRRWKLQGIALYVFSSGSVAAQKLLFGHTAFGDLTPLFRGFFDTRTGSKKEPESYRKIAGNIGLEPGAILFLSDVEAELDAAAKAGMKVIQVVREEALQPPCAFLQVCDFEEIDRLLQQGSMGPEGSP